MYPFSVAQSMQVFVGLSYRYPAVHVGLVMQPDVDHTQSLLTKQLGDTALLNGP